MSNVNSLCECGAMGPLSAGEVSFLYTRQNDVQPRPPTGKAAPFLSVGYWVSLKKPHVELFQTDPLPSVASAHPLCWLLSPFSQTPRSCLPELPQTWSESTRCGCFDSRGLSFVSGRDGVFRYQRLPKEVDFFVTAGRKR